MGPELYYLLFTPQGQTLLKNSIGLMGKVTEEIFDLIGASSNPKTPNLDLGGGWPIVIHIDPEPSPVGGLTELFGPVPGSGSSTPSDPIKSELAKGTCIGDMANKYGQQVANQLGISFTDLAYGGFFIEGSGGGLFGSDKLFRARCPQGTIFMGFECDGTPRCIEKDDLQLMYLKAILENQVAKDPVPEPPSEPPPEPKPVQPEPQAPTSGETPNQRFSKCFVQWFNYFFNKGFSMADAQEKAYNICLPAYQGFDVLPPPEPKPEEPKPKPPVTRPSSSSLGAFWLKCYKGWMNYLLSLGIPYNEAHRIAVETCKTVYTTQSFKTPPRPIRKPSSTGGLVSDADSITSPQQRKENLPSTPDSKINLTKELFLGLNHSKKY